MSILNPSLVVDPVAFCEVFWPEVHFYDKQREVMYSVRDTFDTIVPAGNMLGDYPLS